MKKLIFLLLSSVGCYGAAILPGGGGTSSGTPVINFKLFNNGRLYGPQGQISTAGSTTSGIQEAINACLTAISLHTPPAGGGRIVLEAGTYACTSQITISNRFANPISIEGVSDAPSTIIRLTPGSGKDGITTLAPVGTGNVSLNLRNLVLAYEGIFKQRVMKLTDVQRLQCDNVYFCSWGFVTNGGLDGNVFSSYATAHGASVVGVELGTYNFSDSTFGLAIFNNCRFADLAAGCYTTVDHTWFNKCHFLLIGGANKQSPGTNNWTAGVSFTVPDSMYALHPAIVNYSLNGDVRIDDPNIYFTYCFLLEAHQGAFGHPVVRNTTASGLEAAAWFLLQYDDLNNGNAGQVVEIEAAPEPSLMGNISLVAKPGTITNRYPVNVRISKSANYAWGGLTNLALTKIGGSTIAPGAAQGFNAGVFGGQNQFSGLSVLDQLAAGISVDPSTLTVSGGTDAGINGTYHLSDRMYCEVSAGGAVNTFSWTNATWAIVVNEDHLSIFDGVLGAFYKLGDQLQTNAFYAGQGLALYPGYLLPVAGVYLAEPSGLGTPPTVAFTYTTNTAYVAGNLQTATLNVTGATTLGTVNVTSMNVTNVTGDGSGFTNVQFAVIGGENSANLTSGFRYANPLGGGGANTTTENTVSAQTGPNVTFARNFYVTFRAAIGAGTNIICTVFTNGVATQLTMNFNGPQSANFTISDTTDVATLPANGTFSIGITGNGATPTFMNYATRLGLWK